MELRQVLAVGLAIGGVACSGWEEVDELPFWMERAAVSPEGTLLAAGYQLPENHWDHDRFGSTLVIDFDPVTSTLTGETVVGDAHTPITFHQRTLISWTDFWASSGGALLAFPPDTDLPDPSASLPFTCPVSTLLLGGPAVVAVRSDLLLVGTHCDPDPPTTEVVRFDWSTFTSLGTLDTLCDSAAVTSDTLVCASPDLVGGSAALQAYSLTDLSLIDSIGLAGFDHHVVAVGAGLVGVVTDDVLRVYDLGVGRLNFRADSSESKILTMTAAAPAGEGRVLIDDTGQAKLLAYDATTGIEVVAQGPDGERLVDAIPHEGHFFVATGWDGVAVLEQKGGRLVRTAGVTRHWEDPKGIDRHYQRSW